MSAGVILICEDDRSLLLGRWRDLCNALEVQLEERTGKDWEIHSAQRYDKALLASRELADDDVVLLDSNLGRGPEDGNQILVDLRGRGCKCFAVWVSLVLPPPRARESCYEFRIPPELRGDWHKLAALLIEQKEEWERRRDEVVWGPPEPCRSASLLPALSLLCQGYLAVHEDAGEHDEVVRKALEQMGWIEFRRGKRRNRGGSLVRKDLGKQKEKVDQVRWWLEVFDFVGNRKPDERGWARFCDELKNEWGKEAGTLPSELEKLLGLLANASGTVSEPRLVAETYLCISQRLETQESLGPKGGEL